MTAFVHLTQNAAEEAYQSYCKQAMQSLLMSGVVKEC